MAYCTNILYVHIGTSLTVLTMAIIKCKNVFKYYLHLHIAANQYGGSGAMHSVSATTSSSTSITTSASTSSSDVPNGVTSSSSWDLFTALGLGPSLPTPVPSPLPGTGAGTVHASLDGENESEFMLSGGAKNALVAVQRYYSNVSADFDRQQSIDLLLGIVSSTLPSLPSFFA